MTDTITLRLWEMTRTEKAYRFSKTPPERLPDPVWLPISVIEHITRYPAAFGEFRPCDVTLPEWLAREKGLL